jgi:hypothetical protein
MAEMRTNIGYGAREGEGNSERQRSLMTVEATGSWTVHPLGPVYKRTEASADVALLPST